MARPADPAARRPVGAPIAAAVRLSLCAALGAVISAAAPAPEAAARPIVETRPGAAPPRLERGAVCRWRAGQDERLLLCPARDARGRPVLRVVERRSALPPVFERAATNPRAGSPRGPDGKPVGFAPRVGGSASVNATGSDPVRVRPRGRVGVGGAVGPGYGRSGVRPRVGVGVGLPSGRVSTGVGVRVPLGGGASIGTGLSVPLGRLF